MASAIRPKPPANRPKPTPPVGAKVAKPTPVPRPIKSCEHVTAGAVWCHECASLNLAWARSEYRRLHEDVSKKVVGSPSAARAMRKAHTAKRYLTDALSQYAITPQGIQGLERQYAEAVAKDPVSAAGILNKISEMKAAASARNIASRESAIRARAREATEKSLPQTYAFPPRNELGKFDLAEVLLVQTSHARERTKERVIPVNRMIESIQTPVGIIPQGRGRWKIMGTNGVALCGFFRKHEDRTDFVITTTYESDVEEEMSVPNAIRIG